MLVEFGCLNDQIYQFNYYFLQHCVQKATCLLVNMLRSQLCSELKTSQQSVNLNIFNNNNNHFGKKDYRNWPLT